MDIKYINKFLNDFNKMTDGAKLAFLYDNINLYFEADDIKKMLFVLAYSRVSDDIKNIIVNRIINYKNNK